MLAIGRNFGALYLATVLMQLGSTLLMTYLALRLNANGVAEFWVGSLMAANAIGMVLGGMAGHTLIKRAGHVRTYSASAGMIAAAVLVHELSIALPVWLALRVLVGAAMMCQMMVLESWLNERVADHKRGSAMALYMVATYIGMISGNLMLSLAGNLSVHLLLGVAMAFALCQIPLAMTRSTPPVPVQPVPVDVSALFRRVPQALLTVLLCGVVNASFFGLAAIYVREQGWDTRGAGLFMAVVIGAGLLAQIPMGKLSDRVSRISLIRWVSLLMMFACLPLGFYKDLPWAVLLSCGALIGSLQFCFYGLGVGLANECIEPELRVPLSGLLLTFFAVGSCVGPLISGALMDHLGANSLYYFFAACAGTLSLALGRNQMGRRPGGQEHGSSDALVSDAGLGPGSR